MSKWLEKVVQWKLMAQVYFILITLIIIHCTHYLSSHRLRAYSKISEIRSTYRLVSYLLADN